MLSTYNIPSLPYDTHFMPLTSDSDVSENSKVMTKSAFKQFMVSERKKEEFNGRLFEYSKEHEKHRLTMKKIKNKIHAINEAMNQLEKQEFKGTMAVVVMMINDTKEKLKVYNESKKKLNGERSHTYIEYRGGYDKFMRDSKLTHIEHEVYMEEKKVKQEDDKALLKRVTRLPDELLRVIQSYFTYETRLALLYKTVKMITAFKKPQLKKMVNHIYKKYYPICKNVDGALYDEMRKLSIMFGPVDFTCKLSMNEIRLFGQHLFSLFKKYGHHDWCYDMYRAINVMHVSKPA
jgi:hypothetical protein